MSRPATVYVRITGTIIGETEKAIRLRMVTCNGVSINPPQNEWFPFSQITSITHPAPDSDELASIMVPEWICEKKGLFGREDLDDHPWGGA
jgi:hypothetical protein